MFQHFDWDLTYQVLFLYILPSHHMNLREQLWKMLIHWCSTDICSSKFFAKVSLMLENPFLVPSLCKLNHISSCLIQVITKSPAKLPLLFRKSNVFFEVISGVWGRSVNFNINFNLDFYQDEPCFQTIHFLWLCLYYVFLVVHDPVTRFFWRICICWIGVICNF